jgi:hypothetical protein
MQNSNTSTMPEAPVLPTDAEILERAEKLLAQHPYRAVQYVICEAESGSLILKGRVPTYHLKQMAQAAVTELCALARIDNRIEVPERPGR